MMEETRDRSLFFFLFHLSVIYIGSKLIAVVNCVVIMRTRITHDLISTAKRKLSEDDPR